MTTLAIKRNELIVCYKQLVQLLPGLQDTQDIQDSSDPPASLHLQSALLLKCRCNVWHTDQVQCNVQSCKKRKNQQYKIFYLVSSSSTLLSFHSFALLNSQCPLPFGPHFQVFGAQNVICRFELIFT